MPVQIVEGRLRASQRVESGRPDMRHDVGVVGRAVEFLLQAQPHGAMPPARDTGDRPSIGMLAQVFVGHQHDSCAAVGHLAAVESAQPAFDQRIALVVVADRVGDFPFSGLRVGVSAGVAEVELGDRPQMGFVQSVAAVVLVGDRGEHRRPQELRVCPFVPGPGRGAEMTGRGVTGHGLFQLDAEDQRGVVVARSQVGHRRQRGHTSRCAGGFVPRGRGVPQSVAHGCRHGAEVTLLGEHLAECVGDVDHTDVSGVDLGRGEGGVDDLAGQIREVEALFGEVSGEVALVAAEDPDVSVHSRTLLQLKE